MGSVVRVGGSIWDMIVGVEVGMLWYGCWCICCCCGSMYGGSKWQQGILCEIRGWLVL